jgi:hypothetical protein
VVQPPALTPLRPWVLVELRQDICTGARRGSPAVCERLPKPSVFAAVQTSNCVALNDSGRASARQLATSEYKSVAA